MSTWSQNTPEVNFNVVSAWLKQFNLCVTFAAENVQDPKELSLVDKHTLVFGYVLSWFIAHAP